MSPKVSIIIPVYNGSNYLKFAIDSALSQTYKNLEVIVVNDGSKDGGATDMIAKSYGDKIKYFVKENGGVSTALNLGIEKMSGEYFSWLSHDDIYYSEKIEKQVGQLEKTRSDLIIISDWTIIDKDGNALRQCVIDDKLETIPMCFLAFDTTTWLNACAMLIPVSAIKKCGGFDVTLKTTQDYDMHYKLIRRGITFKILHQPLLYSRVHSEQGSARNQTATGSSDAIHEKIISSLSDSDINSYFGNKYTDIKSVYEAYLTNDYRISSTIFIKKMISLSIKNGNTKLAKALSREVIIRKIISVRIKNRLKRLLAK